VATPSSQSSAASSAETEAQDHGKYIFSSSWLWGLWQGTRKVLTARTC